MMGIVRDEVRQIAPYNAGMTLAELVERYAPAKIAKLGSNESPLGPTPRILEELELTADRLRLYPDPLGRRLRQRLSQVLQVDAARLILGNGSEDLLSIICRAVVRPGDRVATLYPSFPLHEDYASTMGAVIERVRLKGDLTIDIDALLKIAQSGPRMLIFANPMNPSGCWMSAADLQRLAEAAPPDCLLVVDEAYFEYAQGDGYADGVEVLRAHRRPWIVLRTFSKAWGLAGLRVGYGVTSDPDLRAAFDRVRTPFNVNALAQEAAVIALEDRVHLNKVVALAVAERGRVTDFLRDHQIRTAPSKGNFLFFDCGRNAADFTEGLLRRGVIVKPWMQAGYDQFIRVSMGGVSENDHFMSALFACL